VEQGDVAPRAVGLRSIQRGAVGGEIHPRGQLIEGVQVRVNLPDPPALATGVLGDELCIARIGPQSDGIGPLDGRQVLHGLETGGGRGADASREEVQQVAASSADRLGGDIGRRQVGRIPNWPPVIGVDDLAVHVKSHGPDHAGAVVLDVGFAQRRLEGQDTQARAQIVRAVGLGWQMVPKGLENGTRHDAPPEHQDRGKGQGPGVERSSGTRGEGRSSGLSGPLGGSPNPRP